MSLYKTSEGYGIDYRDEYGRRRRKFVGTEEAAKVIEARITEEVARSKKTVNRFASGENLTLTDAKDIWLATLPVGKVRREKLNRSLAVTSRKLGNMKVSQVTPKLLTEYAAARSTEIAPSTQAHENGALKAWFAFLHERWYLPSNPAEALSTKCPRQSPGTAISYDEERELLEKTRTTNTRLKVILALDAGLRTAEIMTLRREHWNRDEQTLTVFSTKTRNTRLIPLTRRLQDALDAHATIAPGERLIQGEGDHSNATDFIRRTMRKSTSMNFRFHDLRHTFATRCAAAAAKPHHTRVLLGHAARNTTDVYLHPSLEELRSTIAAMEAANPNATQKPLTDPQQQKQKEEEEMPGKRFDMRVKGTKYGPLNHARARITEEQNGATPGAVRVEAQGKAGTFIVSLKDLKAIEQPSTNPKEKP